MASVSYQIANLLEKMTSNDKDFRFMATNDLMTELQKDSIKLDDDSERKVVKMLLRLLEDKNGEVQNLAVKCLGPLVNKVKEYQVEGIVETLCANMLSDTEQLRDISSIGLKTVISELPLGSNTLAANVCKKITGRLSSAIEKQEDVSVQLEALDILADLLSRFGGLLISFHPMLLNSLLPQLASPRQAVRKRTIVALSHLVMSCNASLYNKLIDHLLDGLSSSKSASVSRTHIQCIASICDKSTASSMKIETLVFVWWLVRGPSASGVRAHIAVLLPAVLACVADPFYKVTAEALRVLQQIVKIMRPLDNISSIPDEYQVESPPEELQQFIPAMYSRTLVRLRATDMDQEVKERAIATCGQLICHFGDFLQTELPVCLPIFLERLRNEITRLTTVKALTKIASSPLRIDLRPILIVLEKESTCFETIDIGAARYFTLVCEADLHCAQTALSLISNVCRRCPAALTHEARAALTPNILALANSPLLQALVEADVAGCSRRELLALLIAPVHRPTEHNATAHHIKQGSQLNTEPEGSSIKLVHAIIRRSKVGSELCSGFRGGWQSAGVPALHTERDRRTAQATIIACESTTPEGVKALRPFIPEIWVQLSKHCQCAEEGSRNVVAECLGKLCLLEPQDLLPHLKDFLKSPEALTRTTAVTAVKFTISDQLLVPLRDPELCVRRVALVAFNSAAHNKPSLHSVDDGLDLRKAAFECMYTLLGTCLDRLDVFEFLRHVEDGLRDHYDIKMLTYLIHYGRHAP
ncbi:unnamed protein product [Leptidea sinapis]|uniref:TATA-binding protein interacting (TIP20) domain-containing protein n=1 Tax=Leptidea sinapis TaxID=189913 RepID=A0A5E4PWZ5_9NEOP|nr:unnamed protein product [Leptidea sinapis]